MATEDTRRVAVSFSIGFDKDEWKVIEEALRIWHHVPEGWPLWECIGISDRNRLIRHAAWAVCKAIVRDRGAVAPLACDLRPETSQETADRLGRPVPELTQDDNVILLQNYLRRSGQG